MQTSVPSNKPSLQFRFSPPILTLLVMLGMFLHGFISFYPHLEFISVLHLLHNYQHWIRYVFYFTLFLHVIEGGACIYQLINFKNKLMAHHSKVVNLRNYEKISFLYVIQTLIVGFPTFEELHEEMNRLLHEITGHQD
ncbi:hypothetical protein FDP41_002731 [Naegleria fowleri]|uniref:Uncharacterized protein n=1 Tax=Naegleria fowleri TaxID=5763 RepID=A0A6A5BSP6_NAEFO|nr:uncharacterized protein FDP41_002731 [Naegleria fowleri]KAF0978216.1 hypothetical protein FDP41_002731 [Naegleria fowleri]CAG4708786.1 unnamed protein product [Naegleria fowleri]